MNQELFESGIQTENSDIRAHVSVVGKSIYVFPTVNGIAAMESCQNIKEAGQPGVAGVTGKGKAVPWQSIAGIRKLQYHSWPRWGEFDRVLSTSQKGKLAVECVIASMKIGRFPFWLDAAEDSRENIQVAGTDIVVFCKKKIQVKCDYYCGDGGTGNIFLQFAERNPLKFH
jgi:hypothetical protein